TGTVPPHRSLDTGVAGIHRAACDRAECAGASGHRAAGRTKSAAHRLDARVLEPIARPRPPALQARGARLDATLALARLVGAAAGAGRAGTGARGARRRHASGAGQRALWGLGGVHPGRGVAWAGAASRLGGPASPDRWTAQPAHYGHGPQALPGTLVIGQGLAVLPWHQRGPASVHQRLAQYGRRQAHLARKHPRQRPDAARQTDPWVVLFTSHSTWLAAVRSYDRRWATEGSYRDAQSGWDGQHGWDLEVALARLSDAVVVERVVGLWALGALVQTWVGHRLGQRSAPAPVPL